MFAFANCLIMIFLFDATSSKSTPIHHQNPSHFWHDLMQEIGICDKQIEQMADKMDESDSFIEKLSKEENYKPPRQSPKHTAFELKHQEKQSLFLNLFKLDNFYELIGRQEKVVQDLAKTFNKHKKYFIKMQRARQLFKLATTKKNIGEWTQDKLGVDHRPLNVILRSWRILSFCRCLRRHCKREPRNPDVNNLNQVGPRYEFPLVKRPKYPWGLWNVRGRVKKPCQEVKPRWKQPIWQFQRLEPNLLDFPVAEEAKNDLGIRDIFCLVGFESV